MILQSLLPDGRRLLTREFLHGEYPRWSDEEYRDLVAPLERPVLLDKFIAALPSRLPSNKAHMDGKIAVAIHQSLPLDRREAADPGVWRFLAVVTAPEFIRLRWSADEKTFRSRFWTPGTRPDSNYYSRLWWIAELTAGVTTIDKILQVAKNKAALKTLGRSPIVKSVPLIPAIITLTSSDASAAERVSRAIAGEIGIGPMDLETVFDLSMAAGHARAESESKIAGRMRVEGASYASIALATSYGPKF